MRIMALLGKVTPPSAWTDVDAWAITNVYGDIHSVSREARELLGLTGSGRGENLLQLFPSHWKAFVVDIEVALTGWPTSRTLLVSGSTAALRYLVCRRLDTAQLELFWHLQLEQSAAPS